MSKELFRAWKATESKSTTPLKEEFSVPLLELGQLFKMVWCLTNSEANPGLRVKPKVEGDWESIEAKTREVKAGQLIGHDEAVGRFEALQNINDIVAVMGELPNDTELELFTYGDQKHHQHRYLGQVKDGHFQIKSTYPTASVEQLTKAMKFCQGDTLLLETPEQATRATELVSQEWEGLVDIELSGCELKIRINDEEETELYKYFCLQALFPDGPWTFPEPETSDDPSLSALFGQIQSNLMQAPAGKKVIYESKKFTCHLENFTGCPHITVEDVEILDEELQALGFQALGDFGSPALWGTVMRAYANQSHDFGVAYATAGTEFSFDFFSEAVDGKTLTTSSKPEGQRSGRGSTLQYAPELTRTELFELHRSALVKLGEKKEIPPTLPGLAKSIGDFMKKHKMIW